MTCTWIVSLDEHPFLKIPYRFNRYVSGWRCSLYSVFLFQVYVCFVFLRLAAAAGGDLAIDFTSIQNKTGRYTNKAAPQRKRSRHCLCAFSVTLQIWYLPFAIHQRIGGSLLRARNPKTAYLHGIPYSQMGGRSASSIIQLLRQCDLFVVLMLLRQTQPPPFFHVQIVNSDGMMTPCAFVHMVSWQASIPFVFHIKEKRIIFNAGIEHCM